ncbi:hypothetical protein D3C71_1722810 [compost metagenome]
MALLARLHMLLVCATAAFTIIAIFRGRCRLRTIVAVLVALLASLHVLFVRTTLICHDLILVIFHLRALWHALDQPWGPRGVPIVNISRGAIFRSMGRASHDDD